MLLDPQASISDPEGAEELERDEHIETDRRIGRGLFQDAGYGQGMRVVDDQGLADGILGPEIFNRHFLRQEDGPGILQSAFPVPPDQGEREGLQEGRIDGPDPVFNENLVAVADEQAAGSRLADRRFYLGDGGLDGRAHGILGDIDMEFPLAAGLILLDPEEGGSVGVEFIVAELVLNPEPDEQGSGQADGQAGDVDEGIAFLPLHLAPGRFKVAETESGEEAGRTQGPPAVEGHGPVLAVFGGDRLGISHPGCGFAEGCGLIGNFAFNFLEAVPELKLEVCDQGFLEDVLPEEFALPILYGFFQVEHDGFLSRIFFNFRRTRGG